MCALQVSSMITVEEADQIVFQDLKTLPSVCVPLQEAFGKILREDLLADRDLPPFHRVTMDGIAIRLSSWEEGNTHFNVEGMQKAGMSPLTLNNPNACIEVMTGAVLPEGCNCVIPLEQYDINGDQVSLHEGMTLTHMANVHAQGCDCKSGELLVAKGTRLGAPQVAQAAAIGKAQILVSQTPKIAVIGTGDELVGLDEQVEPYQIRQSNAYAVEAALTLHGFGEVTRFHVKDDPQEMAARLGQILKDFDVLILSGGVSKGKFDYVPQVLEELDVKVVFHRVKQRPGKPFWFGKSKDSKPVFALPGNPVSTQIGTYRYVLPYLNKVSGALERPDEYAALDEDVDVKTELKYFLPVTLESQPDGRLIARPIFPNSSGDYASLAHSDGFIELPEDTCRFSKGTSARLYRWHCT